jgi:membrane protein YdbS with pleckstrin-like domain
MTDRYPENIEFDVNRDALRAYLRTRWYLLWLGIPAFFGGFFGLMSVTDSSDDLHGVLGLLLCLARGIGTGLLVSSAISTVLYLLFCHRIAARLAASLRVTVEGAFLRIVEEGYSRVDRKIHFRSIVDYTIVEGSLMRRFGVMSLRMTTTGSNQANPAIDISGLKDCEKVRDMLAEIDSSREKD